jgi:hypothetical protein
MRVLGYFIAAVAYVALLLWVIDKRTPKEAPAVQNEGRTAAENKVMPAVSAERDSAEPKLLVRVVPAKTMDEICADRSKLAGLALDACDKWEKSKSRSGQ